MRLPCSLQLAPRASGLTLSPALASSFNTFSSHSTANITTDRRCVPYDATSWPFDSRRPPPVRRFESAVHCHLHVYPGLGTGSAFCTAAGWMSFRCSLPIKGHCIPTRALPAHICIERDIHPISAPASALDEAGCTPTCEVYLLSRFQQTPDVKSCLNFMEAPTTRSQASTKSSPWKLIKHVCDKIRSIDPTSPASFPWFVSVASPRSNVLSVYGRSTSLAHCDTKYRKFIAGHALIMQVHSLAAASQRHQAPHTISTCSLSQ